MNKIVMMLMVGGTLLATNMAPAATGIKTATAAADSRDYQLIVSSAYGNRFQTLEPIFTHGGPRYPVRLTVLS